MSEELFNRMSEAVIEGEPETAEALARQAINDEIDPLLAITQGYTVGMNEVGKRFGCGEFFLPDLIRAGEAMKAAIRVLEPELLQRGKEREIAGTVVIGTVEGDIHEIGKTLVATMLNANGFRVYDLGVNVKADTFVAKVREVNANFVGLSALLTTTMMNQQRVIQALKEAGLREQVKIMVGGAPITKAWTEQIGADGFAENAASAVTLAKKLAAKN